MTSDLRMPDHQAQQLALRTPHLAAASCDISFAVTMPGIAASTPWEP